MIEILSINLYEKTLNTVYLKGSGVKLGALSKGGDTFQLTPSEKSTKRKSRC